MEYRVIYLESKRTNDSEDISQAINVYAEDGFLLHSIVPKIDGDGTIGYLLTFYIKEV